MLKSAKKNLEKSVANASLEMGPEKRGPKCENCTPVNVLVPFSRFPGTSKSMPNGAQMDPRIEKNVEKT